MPCRVDFREPTWEERESKLVAGLLIHFMVHGHLATRLSIEIPVGTKKAAEADYGDPKILHSLTTALCDYCKEDEKWIYSDARDPMRRKLADWWERHKEADEIREQEQERLDLPKASTVIKRLAMMIHQFGDLRVEGTSEPFVENDNDGEYIKMY